VLRALAVALAALVLLVLGAVFAAGSGWLGHHEGPGTPTPAARPPPALAGEREAAARAASAIGVARPKQILFGDLHVHTTFSVDAFLQSLPLLQGEGAHPPADACDFARHCSALDFWSINDHAEGISPRHWRETVESIRQCNAVGQDAADPDTVAFLGWEWTQIGRTPDDHYGHKNVVLAHTDDARVPARPIAAGGQALAIRRSVPRPFRLGLMALLGRHARYRDFATFLRERTEAPECDPDAHVRDLPADCFERADTPADLYRKLDEWGVDAIVIPHGTTWGFYTPPGSTWDKQLASNDPDRQILLEIYSGHGDSDVWRDWKEIERDADGGTACPAPRPDYLPTCWRAGEIVRARCAAEDEPEAECERRAALARAHAAAAGIGAHLTVPGAEPEEWLDAGQCRDCREPAFNYRPGGAAQYILALQDTTDPAAPRRFRMGFIASSDNHSARPGTGYKEVHRLGFTESQDLGVASGPLAGALRGPRVEPVSRSVPFDPTTAVFRGFQLTEFERQASFFLTGGLVAAHAEGRDRDAVWQALLRREVYGTTGPRILLWFDLLNPPGSQGRTVPMGGEAAMDATPLFQVRAVGSFEQEPGCPEYATAALGPERTRRLCKGECYNPSDRRRRITRIEVVRVRPQLRRDEPVAGLIDDPWRTFPCEPDPAGCAVTFDDPEFVASGRGAAYYARVFEEPAPGVNAGNLRCERDASGECAKVTLCGSPGARDDCLAPHEPRAWSSPIWLDP
jgi:hypothetical protein